VGIASRVDIGRAISRRWDKWKINERGRGSLQPALHRGASCHFTEKMHRSITAIGSALMIAWEGFWASTTEEAAIQAIDFRTWACCGMMILVAMLEPTVLSVPACPRRSLARQAGSPLRPAGSITTVISMFLDNVTTVVLIAPVTILICEILASALPYLLAEALLQTRVALQPWWAIRPMFSLPRPPIFRSAISWCTPFRCDGRWQARCCCSDTSSDESFPGSPGTSEP